MRISYSSLETYRSCPLKYKFKEVDKIKEPKSKEQVFGTLLHSVMQFIHTPGFLSPTLEQALDFFGKNWNSEIFDGDEVEERSAFSQGVAMIQRYYKSNDAAAANIVALESRFAVNLPDGKTDEVHTISGIIDRIDKTDTGYEIIDYKTTRKMPSQESVDNNLQLSVYLRAFLDRYPKEADNLPNLPVSLYFLKHSVKLSATRTSEQLAEVDGVFREVITKIRAEEFPPQVSALCNWCGFQKICPMWRHKFVEARSVEEQEAKQAIDDYIALKKESSAARARAAKLQQTILLYMDQEGVGRVFGENGALEKAFRKTYEYDTDTVRIVLETAGKWNDAVKIDTAALAKIIPSLPASERAQVEAARKIKKETAVLTVKKITRSSD